eukprot:TRINITY_DN28718_c0_g1_i1.p2 TRINITY_DN28718_c0_g1~~TRINITY_DN28718_c0_g1_i1.p2  ORF type:complete len:131 (-),score=13.96 TRINITY_DN28718_c0_g1_i1:26-418(-)
MPCFICWQYNFLMAPVFVVVGYLMGTLVVVATPLRGIVPLSVGLITPILCYIMSSHKHRDVSEYLAERAILKKGSSSAKETFRSRKLSVYNHENKTLSSWRRTMGTDIQKRKWEQTKYQAHLGHRTFVKK